MALHNTTRVSSSPWIDSVWTSRSDDEAEMTAVASETWGLVFWQQDGRPFAAVTGPESRWSVAAVPQYAEFTGIQFAVGTMLRMVSTSEIVDSGLELPDARSGSFWLDAARWQTPGADDAEALVARLVRHEVIIRDPLVTSALDRSPSMRSDRTVERRVKAATGLTRGTIEQIGRVRTAADLLIAGVDVSSVVESCGYYDEPHLARSLRRYVGRTAGQLRRRDATAIALPSSADDAVDRLHDAVGVRG